MSSGAALRAATALEVVAAQGSYEKMDWRSPDAIAFFDWLAQHPPLRRAVFDTNGDGDSFDSGVFAAHIARLLRRRPDLRVDCSGLDGVFDFDWLLCE